MCVYIRSIYLSQQQKNESIQVETFRFKVYVYSHTHTRKLFVIATFLQKSAQSRHVVIFENEYVCYKKKTFVQH